MTKKTTTRNSPLRKKLSRRSFLKASGTIVLVMGGGYCLLPGQKAGASATPIGKRIDVPASDGYLLVDAQKCQGCASCMLACSLVHEGVESQSLSRIQIIQNSFDGFPDDLTISQCRQCVEPACVDVCPEGALTADAEFGNVRKVDRTKCVGCGACVEGCPYIPSRSVLVTDESFDYEDKANKCDLCANTPYHWDDAGGGPNGKQACVAVCPVDAIHFTKEIPVQDGDRGYKVNLRDGTWTRLGYPPT